jgi:putative membrane protein
MFACSPRRTRLPSLAIVALAAALPSSALADLPSTLDPAEVWRTWSWSPLLLGGFAIAATAYGRGIARLWTIAGRYRVITRARASCFYGGLAALFVALVSPLDALGGALFSAHMLQHLVLVAVAAPLVVLGKPSLALVWAVPHRHRPRIRVLSRAKAVRWVIAGASRPLVAAALHAIALWLWHMPALYEAALRSELVHWLEHASFFGTSMLLWTVVVGASIDPAVRMLVLFATAMQSAILGALLTIAPTAWYTVHEAGTRAFGLALLDDQQLAGLIMWIPGGVVYLIAALVAFVAWLEQSARAVRKRERARASARIDEGGKMMRPTANAFRGVPWILCGILAGCEPARERPPMRQVPGGDEARGRTALARYGCGSCHAIPGVHGAVGLAAAPLDYFAERGFVGGVLPNNPDNLVLWIVNPQAVNDRTAMPNLGVTEGDARDMAAYLYTLRMD